MYTLKLICMVSEHFKNVEKVVKIMKLESLFSFPFNVKKYLMGRIKKTEPDSSKFS